MKSNQKHLEFLIFLSLLCKNYIQSKSHIICCEKTEEKDDKNENNDLKTMRYSR